VGNSCPCLHSPECQAVENFSPWMEMAPSYSSLPQVPCPMHLISYTLLILMIWIFTIPLVGSLSPLYLWRFKVRETYTYNQASVSCTDWPIQGCSFTITISVDLQSIFPHLQPLCLLSIWSK
jgi:hypothetical protein